MKAKKANSNLILDPSFFGYAKALLSVFESKLYEEYHIVIATHLYETIRARNYERFAETLSSWEGKRDERFESMELRETWSTILDLRDRITRNFVPGVEVLKQLSPDRREQASRIERILSARRIYHPTYEVPTIKMARELLVVGAVASPILSVSDKAKNWYNKLDAAVVKRVEHNSTMMNVKRQYRKGVEAAGWKGKVFVWLVKHVPVPYLNDIVDLVMVVFANGTYKCQSCSRSLWRFPKDISFCPYCSTRLPP